MSRTKPAHPGCSRDRGSSGSGGTDTTTTLLDHLGRVLAGIPDDGDAEFETHTKLDIRDNGLVVSDARAVHQPCRLPPATRHVLSYAYCGASSSFNHDGLH